MDILPLETLQRIFTLACTDGGHTGNSLALTSKSIRDASRTVRFYTVSLIVNPRRLGLFLALYERECEVAGQGKPRVRHFYAMFPCIPHRNQPGYYLSSLSPPPRNRDGNANDRRNLVYPSLAAAKDDPSLYHRQGICTEETDTRGRQLFASSTASPTYRQAVLRIFQLIAPGLWTLVIRAGFHDECGGALCLQLFTTPFPALHSLTLLDVTIYTHLFPKAKPDGFAPSVAKGQGPLFPSVTHLYLYSDLNDYRLQLRLWASHAPRVTHLRMSGKTTSNIAVDQIAQAVGVTPPSIASGRRDQPVSNSVRIISAEGELIPGAPLPPPPMPLFGELRCLLIQPEPPYNGYFTGTNTAHQYALRELLEFMEACRAAGLQAVVLPTREKTRNRPHLELVRKEWMEVASEIRARAGYWTC
ncbi:hypothetical protein C8Q70DRAFT_324855 [Cubamyces menziesii]|nr:hypothetical protein C8Q70DRAFT_324855 [Cubamyces menziesii]